MTISTSIGAGILIIKTVFRARIKDDRKLESSIDILDYIENNITDYFEKRKYARAIDAVADEIEHGCIEIITKSGITSEGQSKIEEIIQSVLAKASNEDDFFAETHLDSNKVVQKLKALIQLDKDDFEQSELYCIERIIGYIADQLIECFNKVPEFSIERINYLIVELEDLRESVAAIYESLQKLNKKVQNLPDEYKEYEESYRATIQAKYRYIDLFGSEDVKAELRRYKLSTAYVKLEVKEKSNNNIIPVENVFSNSRQNIWLKGEAGSGKTTFLSWLTVNAANPSEEIPGLANVLPLLIKLRDIEDFTDISLRSCFNKVMKDTSFSEIPKGWLEEKIKSGKILFMLDGFDEIDEVNREIIFNWIAEIDPENKCKKIYTSRPQISERPADLIFHEVKILPMTTDRVNTFITYWHDAVFGEKPEYSKDFIQMYINNLVDILKQNESLARLASNPLLCAMISALHFINGMQIPSSKRDLYEACCKMLLEGRDLARRVQRKIENLSYEDKKFFVSKLAFKMMQNNVAETPKDDVIEMFNTTLEYCGKDDLGGADVLEYLIERSGLIKEPEIGKISFIHKSFQEYLCACHIIRESDWDCLIKHIGNPEWIETISIAIGLGNREKADSLLTKTLDIAIKNEHKGDYEKYVFYALDYLWGAQEVTPEIRERINATLLDFIPPTTSTYERVAKAGDIALPHLKDNPSYSLEQRNSSLLALEIIGTKQGIEISKTYFQRELSPMPITILGQLYSKFSDEIIRDTKIDVELYNYLKRYNKKICLTSNMFHYLCFLNDSNMNDLVSCSIPNMHIIDYNNYYDERREYAFPQKLAKNIKSLTIEGAFSELTLLNEFKQLEELTIIARGRKFDLYDLNHFKNLSSVRKWKLVLHQYAYINAKELYFLKSGDELELVLMDDSIELESNGFNKLDAITIRTENPDEIDLNELKGIKNLKFAVPDIYKEDFEFSLTIQGIKATVTDFDSDTYSA